eukprot:COSAG02_NODE_189_length_30109_cov_71.135855_6_plen_118_part_00
MRCLIGGLGEGGGVFVGEAGEGELVRRAGLVLLLALLLFLFLLVVVVVVVLLLLLPLLVLLVLVSLHLADRKATIDGQVIQNFSVISLPSMSSMLLLLSVAVRMGFRARLLMAMPSL